jgi:hypothetical protein
MVSCLNNNECGGSDLASWCTISLGHSFDSVPVVSYVHDRNTWYFPDTSFQLNIVGSDNEALVLANTFQNAVVSVSTFVHTV